MGTSLRGPARSALPLKVTPPSLECERPRRAGFGRRIICRADIEDRAASLQLRPSGLGFPFSGSCSFSVSCLDYGFSGHFPVHSPAHFPAYSTTGPPVAARAGRLHDSPEIRRDPISSRWQLRTEGNGSFPGTRHRRGSEFCRHVLPRASLSVATEAWASPLRAITFTLRPLLVITRITVTLRPGGPLYA